MHDTYVPHEAIGNSNLDFEQFFAELHHVNIHPWQVSNG